MASESLRENYPAVLPGLEHLFTDVASQLGRWRKGKLGLITLVFSFCGLLLVSCVDDVPELTSSDPVLQQGREIYVARCVNCHGATGGGGLGTKLNDGNAVRLYPEVADQISLVANGKNQMAAFKDTLNEDEIEAVVRYTREGL